MSPAIAIVAVSIMSFPDVGLAGLTLTALDRQAIERVAIAEAGDQSDVGVAGVISVILNRLRRGTFGSTAQDVVNASGQFEPVARAGGDWRGLRAPSNAERVRVDTILNLILAGAVHDVTNGALYFQNPSIVARRINAGVARPELLGFGRAPPSAIIGQHAFFLEDRRRRPKSAAKGPEPIFFDTQTAGRP